MMSIPILELFGSVFHFNQLANSAEQNQTPCSATSDLVLSCLSMILKNNASSYAVGKRWLWPQVNMFGLYAVNFDIGLKQT